MRISDGSSDVCSSDLLAGATSREVLDKAPGNDAPIGGIKVVADSGWFAARPSGTEDIYKIYGESFEGRDHLQAILAEAQGIVDAALERDRKSTRLNSSHYCASRMPSSA